MVDYILQAERIVLELEGGRGQVAVKMKNIDCPEL